jgi:hypothetical protein
MILIQGYIGDKPITADLSKDLAIAAYNYRAHALIVSLSTASAGAYVEVFDCTSAADAGNAVDGSNTPRYSSWVPAGDTFSLTHSQFYRGLYVRCVSNQSTGGVLGTLIGTAWAKITAEGLRWPVSGT